MSDRAAYYRLHTYDLEGNLLSEKPGEVLRNVAFYQDIWPKKGTSYRRNTRDGEYTFIYDYTNLFEAFLGRENTLSVISTDGTETVIRLGKN